MSKRTFQNDYEKALYYIGRTQFWLKMTMFFSGLSLVAAIVGAVLRAT